MKISPTTFPLKHFTLKPLQLPTSHNLLVTRSLPPNPPLPQLHVAQCKFNPPTMYFIMQFLKVYYYNTIIMSSFIPTITLFLIYQFVSLLLILVIKYPNFCPNTGFVFAISAVMSLELLLVKAYGPMFFYFSIRCCMATEWPSLATLSTSRTCGSILQEGTESSEESAA